MLQNLETLRALFHKRLKIYLEIRYRYEKKYKRDNISAIESNRENRRLRSGKRKKHHKQRKKRWEEQQEILINEAN